MTNKLKAATDTLGELLLYYVVLILVTAVAFSVIESKSIADSLYWAGITATSIGYGDITPATLSGKLLAIFLGHMSLFVIVPLVVVRLTQRIIDNHHEFTDEEQQYVLDTMKMIRKQIEPQNQQQQQQQAPTKDNGLEGRAPEAEQFFKPTGKKVA